MSKFNSVEPSKMNNNELRSMCTEIQTAKNWGLDYGVVVMSDGSVQKINVARHSEYQQAFQTETGGR